MFRLVPALLAVALFASACGSAENSPASSGNSDLADLTITVDRDGDKGTPPETLKLTCKAPTDSDACGAAAGISDADLAPTPDGTACTQIFGGPETATIKGTIRGNPVDASFSRRDGCEIERWAKVDALLEDVK